MTDCHHGMPAEWCALCRPREPEVLVLEGKTIAARYAGKCPGCGDPVVVGEDVHLTDGGWVCTSCKERIE